ncbi:MAG TPA: type II toxin-antitoxin system RelE/ParE family toxin [Rhizomicrobium sp.]|nr:type II toxin-antitoxin system RelE/ParE family toxin [Rhizomicrobium sp.]
MIVLAPEAIADARRLYEFLEPHNPAAAKRAIAAIWNKLQLVETMPGLGYRTKHPRIRQVRISFGRHGYVARYTIRESDGALIVLRIWHSRENRP